MKRNLANWVDHVSDKCAQFVCSAIILLLGPDEERVNLEEERLHEENLKELKKRIRRIK